MLEFCGGRTAQSGNPKRVAVARRAIGEVVWIELGGWRTRGGFVWSEPGPSMEARTVQRYWSDGIGVSVEPNDRR